jgi:hypothetical protein
VAANHEVGREAIALYFRNAILAATIVVPQKPPLGRIVDDAARRR